MKAAVEIKVPNLRGFENTKLKEGHESYFRILPGEVYEDVCRKNGFTEEEVSEYVRRVLKGNPHWFAPESKEEQKLAEVVRDEHQQEKKRKEALGRLKKAQQVELLKELGAKEIPQFEPDRINLIYSLEQRK